MKKFDLICPALKPVRSSLPIRLWSIKFLVRGLSIWEARLAGLSKVLGSQEKRTRRISNTLNEFRAQLTPQFTKSAGGVAGAAGNQAGATGESGGFVMPTVIVLMSLMAIVAYATLVQSTNSLNLSYKQAYQQMARAASKAAIDYAQEQFDNANCGAYSGTAETTLTGLTNNRYKITMQADVQSTSADGFEKNIVGTGRVYLPKTSTTALYTFDIRSEIVRTYAVCKTPDNFAPLVWLDASNTASLKKSTVTSSTVSPTPATVFGNAGDSTRDTLEERADNGAQTAASWQSNDIEMNICDGAEFTNSICTANSSKYLNIGMVYPNVNVPKNATITSATITLACTNPAGVSGQLNESIIGFYKTASNPHPDLFTQNGSNQLKTPLSTANLHTASNATVSSNNCPPGNNTVWNVTNVAQEIVNNANWNPGGAGNGGRMGFIFTRTSGAGSRHLLKNNNQLSITYSTSTVSQASNGDGLTEWDDISGNGNNAIFVYGNNPTRQDNQINSKPIVRFNSGAFVSTLSSALGDKREFTVFGVLKSNFGTSGSSGRIVSGMTTSGTLDTSNANSIIPLRRASNASGFSSYYDNGAHSNTITCSTNCSSQPYLALSNFEIDTSNNTITSNLRGNGGTLSNTVTNINPGSPPPPYTFGIDQLYFGGHRTGAMPGVGTDYFNGDYAELVIYDKSLSCHEIVDLEDYFRAKWNLNASQWASTCAEDTIPTL